MLLHEETVNRGDEVYDLVRGRGVVYSIADTMFEVDFGNVRVYYSTDGIQRGKAVETLFWSEPYVIAPKKSELDTQRFKARFEAIDAFIETLRTIENKKE